MPASRSSLSPPFPLRSKGAGAAAAIALALTVAVVLFSEQAFEASLSGLKLWFEVVLPALFPFFTLSEILAGLGVIHFIAVLLEPVMRPAFRIPGAGGFAVAMGLVSGYPLGAKITARLRREGLCSQVEAERLVSFANTADPLFMMGAVAVGMFAAPQLGATLSAAHYLSVVLVALLMRAYCRGDPPTPPASPLRRAPLPVRAYGALIEARRRDGRPFGQLFGESVRDAMASMIFIGGSIMLFSVVIRVLSVAGVVDGLARSLAPLLRLAGLDPATAPALVRGLFEITIGTEASSRAQADLAQRLMAASAIIAWSGLSVHAQVAAMLHGTGVRIAPYLAARAMHAGLAAAVTALILRFNPSLAAGASQALAGVPAGPVAGAAGLAWPLPALAWIGWRLKLVGTGLVLMAGAGLAWALAALVFRRVRLAGFLVRRR